MTFNPAPSHFLWPHPQPLMSVDWLAASPSSREVELFLASLFPDSFPVLFSSARAGLSAILQAQGFGRPDKVWIPGYSSHCVIESVGQIATPSPDVSADSSVAVIYHQWGWPHQVTFDPKVCLVEDAVDTFFKPGSSLFQTLSAYVLWSIPKVLGSVGGGVVFCRNEESAENLRGIRNTRGSSLIQGFLRVASARSPQAHVYWGGAESLQGELPSFLRSQVLRMLREYEQLYKLRKSLVEDTFGAGWHEYFGFADRIPSNLPLTVPDNWELFWGSAGLFTAGLRNFNVSRTWPQASWKRVAPFPIHRDISIEDMRLWAKKNNLEIARNE